MIKARPTDPDQFEVQYLDDTYNTWLLWSDHALYSEAFKQFLICSRDWNRVRIIKIVREY